MAETYYATKKQLDVLSTVLGNVTIKTGLSGIDALRQILKQTTDQRLVEAGEIREVRNDNTGCSVG